MFEEYDRERDYEVETLHRQLQEKEGECTDAAEIIRELLNNVQERDAEKEHLETTLRDQITELENRIREKDSDMATCDCYREKMEANLQDTNNEKKEVVSAPSGNTKLVAVVAGWWFLS